MLSVELAVLPGGHAIGFLEEPVEVSPVAEMKGFHNGGKPADPW